MDEKIWETPTEFRPERFLTDSGEIDRHLTNKMAAFGFGKRRCAGEQFAIYNISLFTASLIQKCVFANIDGQKLQFKGINGLTIRPLPFKYLVTQRN